MSTRVYGASDDLIEFDGDVSGEVGYYSADDEDEGCLLVFSDGTLLAAAYGKPGHGAVWGLRLVQRLIERGESAGRLRSWGAC